jgi:hypothetical protein
MKETNKKESKDGLALSNPVEATKDLFGVDIDIASAEKLEQLGSFVRFLGQDVLEREHPDLLPESKEKMKAKIEKLTAYFFKLSNKKRGEYGVPKTKTFNELKDDSFDFVSDAINNYFKTE